MDYLSYAAVGAVAVVLFLGLKAMLKGDNANASQTFMRWRVGLQFIAIVVLMLVLFLARR
jgi:membrane protein DedA with SNARE-associated domain